MSEVKISTKGRYSLRLLLDLAAHRGGGFVSLNDIAERQGISKKYLEQLVTLLKPSDLLRIGRGPTGGYMLAKAPEEITVGQVLRLAEGGLCPVPCLEDSPSRCEQSGSCNTRSIWRGLQEVVETYLDGITLQRILDDQNGVADEYYI